MELEEFISKTLVGIHRGVKAANREINPEHAYYFIEAASNHKDRSDGYIKFDVAVTASSASGSKGSAGIQVWSLGVGGQKESNLANEVVSRIKFGIAPSTTTG